MTFPRLVITALLAAIGTFFPPATARQTPTHAGEDTTPPDARRAQFRERFARAYYPGRSGQLMIVPREGHILTRNEPDVAFMHGSPWSYDADIPLLFVGRSVNAGDYDQSAAQQDVAVTLAAALGVAMPPTATGRVLPAVGAGSGPPRAAMILVLDGMRRDYLTRHAGVMPVLAALRARGAWFRNAQVDYLPTNTASGHSTIATGADPRVHGVNGNNLFDRAARRRHDMYRGWNPRDLMALTLSDVWQFHTGGRAIVIAQGGNATSSTALAGHGACQLSGTRVLHAGYDESSGTWKTNPECFVLAPALAALDARALLPPDGVWMGHRIDTVGGVRRSALFPAFEAEAFVRVVESQPIGQDTVPDLLLMNLKSPDFVGHKFGPESKEMTATLAEVDRAIARILAALEAKVGPDYVLAITADHGMPPEPRGDGGRQFASEIVKTMNTQFDPELGGVVTYYEPENSQLFVDQVRLAALKLTLDDLAGFLRRQPFVDAVFTEDEVRRAAAVLQ